MAREKIKRFTPGVVFQPQACRRMSRGIEKIVSAIQPTLGPIHGFVLIEKESKIGKPELLDDGATIARRIIQLPDPDEDMGAMYLRNILWNLHESVGDGSVTAALIFNETYKGGLKYIQSGGNAMRLRHYLEIAARNIVNELKKMCFCVEGRESLTNLAQTICYDPDLSKMLGEIFDVIGEFGRLEIHSGKGRTLEREYIEGMYWPGAIYSREMIQDQKLARAQMENVGVLITDLEITDVQTMAQILNAAISANINSLLLIARTISEQAQALLLMKKNQEKIRLVAARVPGLNVDDQREGIEDLVILAGGRSFLQAAGDSFDHIQAADFGFARRAWADHQYFGISGGKGDPRRLRLHILELRKAIANCDDATQRKRLQERLGKLLGGSAILSVGDPSPIRAQAQQELAERTAEAIRGAMRNGVLPGGGISLLACKEIIAEKYHQAQDTDERAAYHILARAVEAPICALLHNAGENPFEVMAKIAAAGHGYGYDVIQHKIVQMAQAGIVDSAAVIREATFRVISGAGLALTVDVLLHRSNPPTSFHTT